MRKRLIELSRGRDDVVWASLQALGEDAIGAARQLERRPHHGNEDAGARRELQLAALRADENLRHLTAAGTKRGVSYPCSPPRSGRY